ncbi:uncharacterized protein LOC129922568 [Biomphalaria glabrata]|uniref:Uncharacterized protein LOC129922568 n=1 Tax=Biomphalaria glabrata TaxID=6526 RepID=A0A9W2YQY6_BIOGL|nr:uncharacterized protein LOC129922568 [Biomphalaria glabrata]
MCALVGGYQAENDSRQEFEFIKSFVAGEGYHFTTVMPGGTDVGHEGRWVNRYSGTPVVPPWHRIEPDNHMGHQNCQCLLEPRSWEVSDIECVFNNRQDVGFLCEVND